MSTFEANCRRVAADIKNNDRCTFDVMLKEFLRRVSSAQSNVEDVDNLMKDVLQAMLPICGEIQGQVMAYCNDQGNTDERKKTFANLVNGALARLDMLDEDAHMFSPYTFQEAETSLLAHLNGVVVADGSDEVKFVQTRAQERDKPGIVLTSVAAALRISGKNPGTCREEYMASGPANQYFPWPDILAPFELRRTDNALAPPPDTYTVDCVSNVPPIKDVKEDLPRHARSKVHSQINSDSDLPSYHIPARRTAPAVQAAVYGEKRMGSTLAATHAISFLVVDDVLWVWWHDRQGAIQTNGLNLVQDLPRFLALLFALQRFGLEDWGFHPSLDPLPMQRHKGHAQEDANTRETTIILNNGVEVTNDLVGRPHGDDRIRGRLTEVYNVSEVRTASSSSPPPSANRSYVAKVYWADATRVPEHTVVERAEQEAHDLDVKDHIPYMLGWRDDVTLATNHIRDALSISSASAPASRTKPSRILRIIVFEKLAKVQMLDGKGMMTVILQCIRCHYALWRAGIHHNDLSKSNIMYRIIDGKTYGVVNDWDLATLDEFGHDGFEPAGTIPYMPFDLLTRQYWMESPAGAKRLYRHDNESFVWVMARLALTYDEGARIACRDVDDWDTSDWDWCKVCKWDFATRAALIACPSPWELEWLVARYFVIRIRDERHWSESRGWRAIRAGLFAPPPPPVEEIDQPEETYRLFWERLWYLIHLEGFEGEGELEYLVEEVPVQYRAVAGIERGS